MDIFNKMQLSIKMEVFIKMEKSNRSIKTVQYWMLIEINRNMFLKRQKIKINRIMKKY